MELASDRAEAVEEGSAAEERGAHKEQDMVILSIAAARLANSIVIPVSSARPMGTCYT